MNKQLVWKLVLKLRFTERECQNTNNKLQSLKHLDWSLQNNIKELIDRLDVELNSFTKENQEAFYSLKEILCEQ